MNVNMYKKMDMDMDVDTVMNITFFTKFENICPLGVGDMQNFQRLKAKKFR
jgi:hypothetical protein